jgi:hypothetical protein
MEDTKNDEKAEMYVKSLREPLKSKIEWVLGLLDRHCYSLYNTNGYCIAMQFFGSEYLI